MIQLRSLIIFSFYQHSSLLPSLNNIINPRILWFSTIILQDNYSVRLEHYSNNFAINCYVIILPLNHRIKDMRLLNIFLLSQRCFSFLLSPIHKTISYLKEFKNFMIFCIKIRKFAQMTSSGAEATNKNRWQSSRSIIMSLLSHSTTVILKIPRFRLLNAFPFSLVSSLSTYQLPHFRAPLLSIASFSSSFVLAPVPLALPSRRVAILLKCQEKAASTQQRSNSGTVGIPKGRGKDTRDNVV